MAEESSLSAKSVKTGRRCPSLLRVQKGPKGSSSFTLCIELLPPERPSQHMNMVGGGGSGAWAALVLCFGITGPSEVPVPFTGERLCDKWREERTWPNQSRSSFLGHVTVCAAGSSSLRDSVTQALPACGFTVPGVLSSRPSSESNEHMAFGTNRKHESKVTLPDLI